jgi:hypothetical protein
MRVSNDALVLRKKVLVPCEEQSQEIIYDETSQVWLSKSTGNPFVEDATQSDSEKIYNSRFGETQITATAEGVDRGEIASDGRFASKFGETLLTETGEGSDQSEISFSSRFGETMITKAPGEGSDR